MKQKEIIQKITDLENKLNALGDISTKSQETDQNLKKIKNIISEIEQLKQNSSQSKSEIDNAKNEVDQSRQVIIDASNVAQEYKNTIDVQKQEYSELKKSIETLKQKSEGLTETTEKQLGIATAATLASSFKDEADKLDKSVQKWFWWICGTTAGLLIFTAGIIIWELLTNNLFWNVNFLIKLTITAPIIYFLFFTARQYGREKRLRDEYIFKSAVALSFEAYRKLIKEEISEEASHKEKLLDFIIASVNQIYSSPMENIYKTKEKEEVEESLLKEIMKIIKIIKG